MTFGESITLNYETAQLQPQISLPNQSKGKSIYDEDNHGKNEDPEKKSIPQSQINRVHFKIKIRVPAGLVEYLASWP
ncbi:hypothetical protein NQ317_011880 [Molorchus minor]|uniref:Uncharacterized protein n=1 Tax=Molorchus minor TaxID=1323400 RepID=A0ABQ9JTK7_9CUCU|nr:hypothetical protein NQ317_011880 [Molorchus minor]